MCAAFVTRRRVQFRDTDAAGIMHFSTFFTCMEEAEHELLRSVDTSVHVAVDSHDPLAGKLSWPRVAAECQYVDAAHFEEILEIEVQVARIGTSSVTYEFQFHVSERLVAHGTLTTVHCPILPAKPPPPLPITHTMRRQMAAYQND